MMKVKCREVKAYHGLSHDKVYDVIKYVPSDDSYWFDCITIINDDGIKSRWYYNSFDDVTAEYRDEVIDGILN